MKRILLAGAAAAAMLHTSTASAQWIVEDIATELAAAETAVQAGISATQGVKQVANQAIQISQLAATVNAVVHGDVYAVAGLVPELASAGLIDPLAIDSAGLSDLISGIGQATDAGRQFLGQVQAFKSNLGDYRGQALDLEARALANRLGTSKTLLDASRRRMTLLPGIVNRPTADLKDAADKSARLSGELAIQSAQSNQLGALDLMSRTHQEANAAREAQMWRCSAERLLQDAWTAAGGSASGAAPSCNLDALAPSSGGADTGRLMSDAGGAGQVVRAASAPDGEDGGTLARLTSQSWGAQAAENAMALGVNPSALAATCVLESNCSANVGGTGTISGAFQMTDGTYAQTVAEARASNPALARQITGKNDPASQSIAASQYLVDGANALQAAGVSNPTVLDSRSYYQFGPRYGVDVATAADSQLMSDVLAGTSVATLRANGITPSTTVAQWRATVTNKIGAAASQPVLLGASA